MREAGDRAAVVPRPLEVAAAVGSKASAGGAKVMAKRSEAEILRPRRSSEDNDERTSRVQVTAVSSAPAGANESEPSEPSGLTADCGMSRAGQWLGSLVNEPKIANSLAAR